ncbi:MAG: ceramidase domain-containing protein [Flavisolibacter sp.]|nr:ceramidase domain-containing protein [Flavisolibacter sp.]
MTTKHFILPFVALLCIIWLLFIGPVPQSQTYHHFADQRGAWGVPNFLNVITNLPFAFVGFWGLYVASRLKENRLKAIVFTLFIGFLLLSVGSGYYHFRPNNDTLVYDRIPIAVIILSFFVFIIYDRVDSKKGFTAFILLNLLGILSVIYWIGSEHIGRGDLRWYGMAQFFPLIAIPLVMFLYKSAFNPWKEILLIYLFFGLAKFTETFDKEIYHWLGTTISGHSLKHLLMAAAGYIIVLLMRLRKNYSSRVKTAGSSH